MPAQAPAQPPSAKVPRIGLVDTIRGIALLAMATYHFTWDMEFMGYMAAGTAETGWLKLYARAIASTFLFLVGVSLVLANTPNIRWQPFAKRLAAVAGAAVLISVATYFFTPGEWIFFGILHCIAVVSILGLFFLRIPLPLTVLLTLALFGIWVSDTWGMAELWRSDLFDPRYLAWTGLAATPIRSNDFVPLFPWLLPFLIGLSVARLALWTGFTTRLAQLGTGGSFLARLGRHSLLFYLVHQPVLIAIAWGLTFVVAPPKPDPAQTYLRQCNASCQMEQGEALCKRFCQCTLDRLQADNLFAGFQAGSIRPEDDRVQSLANQCSAEVQ